jgi:hypothetical protein
MKEWQKTSPELFVKKMRNRPGLDNYAATLNPVMAATW